MPRPGPPKQSIAVRMDERMLKIVDCTIQQLAERNPDLLVSRSDAIRHIIASSAGVAAPIASTKPPDQKPMRSG